MIYINDGTRPICVCVSSLTLERDIATETPNILNKYLWKHVTEQNGRLILENVKNSIPVNRETTYLQFSPQQSIMIFKTVTL